VQWGLSLPSVFGVELRLSDTSPSRILALTPSGACVSRFTKHLLKSPRRSRTRRSCRPPTVVRTDNTPTVRFSAALGEEPEVELALV
jgi:hypothetical protein